MNYVRILLASLGGFVAYFVFGGISFGLVPSLRNEFLKYPAIYRSQQGIKSTMPFGMAAMFVAIVALAFLYALLNQSGSGVAAGARFGALIGIYSVGSFVVHNYVNLNIGGKLTAQQAVAYFIEWLIVGIVIGLIVIPAESAEIRVGRRERPRLLPVGVGIPSLPLGKNLDHDHTGDESAHMRPERDSPDIATWGHR